MGIFALFADTTIIFSHNLKELENIVNESMIKISEWINSNELILNYKKCSFIVIGSRNPCGFNVRIKNRQLIN